MRITLLILLMIFQPVVAFNQKAGGQTAPAFSLKDLKGKRARLSDYKGKVVLVNFWATWCAPCRAEMPDLVRWQNEYKDQGLQIIGITYPPYRTIQVREAARRLKINYPILFGTDEVAALYDAGEVLPFTVIIDRDGNIRDRIKGIIDAEEFEQKIKPLLQTTSKTVRVAPRVTQAGFEVWRPLPSLSSDRSMCKQGRATFRSTPRSTHLALRETSCLRAATPKARA